MTKYVEMGKENMKNKGKSKVKITFANITLCVALAASGIALCEKWHADKQEKEQTIRLERELKYVKENPIKGIENEMFEVCTINVQNKYTSEESTFQSGSDLVVSFAKDGIDIIGTQEMKLATKENLENLLESDQYQVTGEPRWGTGIVGGCFDFANETNSIIVPNSYMSKTVTLPWFPQNLDELSQSLEKGSIMARIVTSNVVAIENVGYVRCYNTHLDYGVSTIQRRQMDALLELIDKDNQELALPIIITGDFNAELEDENMKYFIEQLAQRGIQVAANKEKTTYKGKQQDGQYVEEPKLLDYIFYSEDFSLIDYEIIDNKSSDHDAVFIKLKNKQFDNSL